MFLGSFYHIKCLTAAIFIIYFFLAHIIVLSDCEKLDDYIHDYQTLTFDTHNLHKKHERARRSTDSRLHLQFQAYKRNFTLQLRQDTEIFSSDHHMLELNGHQQPVDTSFIYSGVVKGFPKSHAHIAIINGTARGYVYIPGDTTYHIESAEQYFENPLFHAVIYPETHVDKDPFRHKRAADDVGSCGMDRVREWMDKVSRSAVEDTAHVQKSKRSVYSDLEKEHQRDKYSAEFNKNTSRKKRTPLNAGKTCFLYLRSDPEMWKYVKNEKFKQVLSDERAKEEILAFFASHVSALKNIFTRTTFTTYNKDLRYNGIDFVVQRTSIMTPQNQFCDSPSKRTAYCNPNIDVSNFLNLNSMDQHDEFCLAYIFTHRDFTRGTLGLAWVGAREVASGGICEKHKNYLERDETVPKSLNTGIVTTVNYGKAVPPRVSQLTFTHEVGHNFGSPHDQGDECAPFGTSQPDAEAGNYIMFASATMGDRPNNDDFSICSKDNITRLLHVVINELHSKRNCFKASETAFCGNGIKENDEQCDCGYVLDCEDKCCYGRESDEGQQCKLKPTAKCSTSSHAECPPPKWEPEGKLCNDDTKTCHQGECVNSVCEKIGWKECFLTADSSDESLSRESLCYVSCANNFTSKCVSSFDQIAVAKPENAKFLRLLQEINKNRTGRWESTGIQLPAGSPCDNFRGYCDVFHKCRGVDADGPLARLKNLIFNPETLENIQEWIVKHWWAVMLMGIALVIVMGAFIKICAVHTPSSNPRKPKHRQLTLPRTLQRRRHQQQQAGQSSGQNQGRSGAGGSRRPMARSVEERKPANSEIIQIDQGPPPPYSSAIVSPIPAPSSSSAPLLTEVSRAPDLSTIPSGGPKRGHGGARKKEPEKPSKGKKKVKNTVELQRL
ncbi:Disintegrin and metalloproteinase domain-containing protein 10 [Bulinus truncatus]|nr:Disintegrin and metalloproteinase domain-containing protein 10 [Bulinus truncatus]